MRHHSTGQSFADGLTLRRLSVDDLSNVRYLHSLSFRSLVGLDMAEEDAASMLSQIGSPDYGDRLMGERHILAFAGSELVGSAGWCFNAVGTPEARLVSVFVHPMFVLLGIGRRLVAAIEEDARNLGFDTLHAPTPEHAMGFLRRLGFAAHGGDFQVDLARSVRPKAPRRTPRRHGATRTAARHPAPV